MQIHLETFQNRACTSARAARQNVDIIKIHFFLDFGTHIIFRICTATNFLDHLDVFWIFHHYHSSKTHWSSSDSILNANGKKQLFFTVIAHFWLHPLKFDLQIHTEISDMTRKLSLLRKNALQLYFASRCDIFTVAGRFSLVKINFIL